MNSITGKSNLICLEDNIKREEHKTLANSCKIINTFWIPFCSPFLHIRFLSIEKELHIVNTLIASITPMSLMNPFWDEGKEEKSIVAYIPQCFTLIIAWWHRFKKQSRNFLGLLLFFLIQISHFLFVSSGNRIEKLHWRRTDYIWNKSVQIYVST